MVDRTLEVLLLRQQGHGWGPVTAMAQMAARLAGTELRTAQVQPAASKLRLATAAAATASTVPLRAARSSDLLVIVPVPGALNDVLLDGLLRRHRRVMAWVIDSFWTERIPSTLRLPGLFSHIYITDPDDEAEWQQRVAATVGVLPWGTDALAAHHQRREADTDVVRVGRQPPAWDDDTVLKRAAATAGLSFRGRPPMGDSEAASLGSVHDAYARSRVVLASGNATSQADYTHPTKEYVTARWTDALAHGCLVAGTPPKCGAAANLLPEAGLVRVKPDDVAAGMEAIRSRLNGPSPEQELRLAALTKLDWRFRLATIFEEAGVSSAQLDCELMELQQAAEATRAAE